MQCKEDLKVQLMSQYFMWSSYSFLYEILLFFRCNSRNVVNCIRFYEVFFRDSV